MAEADREKRREKPSDKAEAMHHLPLNSLEKQLKKIHEQNSSFFEAPLTPDEMISYINWIAEQYGGKDEFQFSMDDLHLSSGNRLGEAGTAMLKDHKSHMALAQLAEIYKNPGEQQYFTERQSISSNRILRYFPANWQISDCFEILYVFSGDCPICFENEEILLTPGTVLLIPPEIARAINCQADDRVVFYYMIRSSTFSRLFWEQLSDRNPMSLFFRQALRKQNNTNYLRFDTGQDPMAELLLYEIYEQYTSGLSYSEQIVNSLMGAFFLYLLQHFEQSAQVSRKSKFYWKAEFSDILTYIEDHFATVTIEELGERFHYSRRQIIRIIQNSTGRNFSQLMTQLKMERASELLLVEGMGMEQIASETGYSTVSSFYRAFNAYFHCTPGCQRDGASGLK